MIIIITVIIVIIMIIMIACKKSCNQFFAPGGQEHFVTRDVCTSCASTTTAISNY